MTELNDKDIILLLCQTIPRINLLSETHFNYFKDLVLKAFSSENTNKYLTEIRNLKIKEGDPVMSSEVIEIGLKMYSTKKDVDTILFVFSEIIDLDKGIDGVFDDKEELNDREYKHLCDYYMKLRQFNTEFKEIHKVTVVKKT